MYREREGAVPCPGDFEALQLLHHHLRSNQTKSNLNQIRPNQTESETRNPKPGEAGGAPKKVEPAGALNVEMGPLMSIFD